MRQGYFVSEKKPVIGFKPQIEAAAIAPLLRMAWTIAGLTTNCSALM
jgi:hypothetical protein